MAEKPSELHQAAAEVEGALLLKAQNEYLRRRVVHLRVQVETLSAEVERLTEDADDPTNPGADEAPEQRSDR